MHLDLPDDIAADLSRAAAQAGSDPQQFAIGAIRDTLERRRRAAEALQPVRDAFAASGLTEDEAFEAEKHAMRRGG